MSRTAWASARSTASPPTPRSSSQSHGVSVVSLWPGFVRTERIDVAVESGVVPDTLDVDYAESPRFTGRAVVALATDPTCSRWSGHAFPSATSPTQYGFRDVDGRLPPGPMQHATPDQRGRRSGRELAAVSRQFAQPRRVSTRQ